VWVDAGALREGWINSVDRWSSQGDIVDDVIVKSRHVYNERDSFSTSLYDRRLDWTGLDWAGDAGLRL